MTDNSCSNYVHMKKNIFDQQDRRLERSRSSEINLTFIARFRSSRNKDSKYFKRPDSGVMC